MRAPLIIHTDRDPRAVNLVELNSDVTRKVTVDNDEIRQVYAWSNSGCALIASLRSGRVVRLDLYGGIRDVLVSSDQVERLGAFGQERVSPDEQWLAYIAGTGNLEFDHWEHQNIEVITLADGNQTPHRLTNNGGAWEPAWAPNMPWLAYGDFDSQGIQQIFVAKPDWETPIQLTTFTDAALQLQELKWSLDGMRIAVRVVRANTNSSGLAIVSAADISQPVIFTDDLSGVNVFWWQDLNTLVSQAILNPNGNESGPRKALVWTDADTGNTIDVLLEADVESGVIEFPAPLSNAQEIGFFSGGHFYVYDASTRTYKQSFQRFADTYSWSASPQDFLSEAACST